VRPQGSVTPTEEVPRIRDLPADVEDDPYETRPRITVLPRDPAVPAASVEPAPTPRITAIRGTPTSARAIGYEDTLRFQRADPGEQPPPEPAEPEPIRAAAMPEPDVPRVRAHATSDHLTKRHAAAVDVRLGAAATPDPSPSDRVRLRAQQVLEEAEPEHERREGLERLVDILEYRELRLRALRGGPGDARAVERCAALEQVLQQRPVAGDDMAAMRRYHRFVCSIPAQLTHHSRGSASTASVEIEDLSAGGAKVTFGEHSITTGETVWLAVELEPADRSRIPHPDAEVVVIQARVVWAQPHEAKLGLVFAGAPRYDVGTAEPAV
jgi:hypothetical protein